MKFARWPTIRLVTMLFCVSSSNNPRNSSPQISVSPLANQIAVGQVDFVTAKAPGNPAATVSWTVNGIPNGNSSVGMIESVSATVPTNATFARYLAPAAIPNPPAVTISAILQGSSAAEASAVITVGPDIAISPAAGEVPEFGSQQFSALVTGGLANTAVTWQISCTPGGSACGAISQTGFYKAPTSVPTVVQNGAVTTQDVTLTATSQADPSFSATIGIEIVPPNRNQQVHPIQLGTSGSNADDFCTASGVEGCGGATLSSLLERGSVQYILTNWHVAAGTDGGLVGDALVQPGLLDTDACSSQQTTTVANVSQLLDPHMETGKKVDVAIAQVVSGAVDPTGTIEQLGSGVAEGAPNSGPPAGGAGISAIANEAVAKSGRSTGLTCGTVQAVDTSVNITYTTECSTATQIVSFSGQIAITGAGFSAGGDSGSLIVDATTAEPVALLFAEDNNGTTSIANPASDVLVALTDSNGNVPVFVGGSEHAVAACSFPAPTATSRITARIWLADMQSAVAIKERHVAQLMSDPAVQGVGVGASLDPATGPALIVYVLKNTAHAAISATVEGLPVRIIETTGFRAGNAGAHMRPCRAPHAPK